MNQKTLLFIGLLILFFGAISQAQISDTTTKRVFKSLNDGPYIFIEKDRLVEKNIIEGIVVTKDLAKDAFKTEFKRAKEKFKKVKKIAALSDIHGQHELAVEILTNHHIIDEQQNWQYGAGHLIIVGDIFDRGSQVNETLWLLYKLEQQAEAVGGKVHVLLGNHEYLIFQQDLRYIHQKYVRTAHVLETSYTDLYGKETVMGRWLRSKPTIVKINDITFVHGGISKAFLASGYNRSEINKIMRRSIDVEIEKLEVSETYSTYFGASGPIWYRGYFYDDLPDEEISDILSSISSNHIIVGHCSNETVVELYDGKVYGVDSSIKLGEYGELLLIEGNEYYRGTKGGKRIKF